MFGNFHDFICSLETGLVTNYTYHRTQTHFLLLSVFDCLNKGLLILLNSLLPLFPSFSAPLTSQFTTLASIQFLLPSPLLCFFIPFSSFIFTLSFALLSFPFFYFTPNTGRLLLNSDFEFV